MQTLSNRILITGITGFVGSHLAEYALAKGAEVYGTKRWHLSRQHNVRQFREKVKWVDCDLTDPIGTRKMIESVRPDRIYHLAAESFVSPSWDHPTHYMHVNYNATVNILDAIRDYKLKTRILIPGSGEEYGEIHEDELPIREETVLRPVNPYAVSKIAQDLIGYVYHKSYGLNVIRTRAFNHEGPRRDKVFGIPWYAYQIARIEAGLQEPVVRTGHIDDRRNFTHIRDMVEAYWLAMEKLPPGDLFLIGTESEENTHTFREALERLIKMSTKKGIKHKVDAKYVRPTNVPRLIGDVKRFEKITGWKQKTPFDTILSDTLDYWREAIRTQSD